MSDSRPGEKGLLSIAVRLGLATGGALFLVLVLFWATGAGLPVARAGAVIIVTNTNDSGPGSLRQALADAAPGDTVTITATGTILLTSGALTVTKSLTITGPGADLLAVDGNHAGRVFEITAGSASISGLTVQNGGGVSTGGGIHAAGALWLNDVYVISNTAVYGGGVHVVGPAELSGGRFENNWAYYEGGGLRAGGALTLTDVQFISNTVEGDGGGVYANGSLTVTGGGFISNTAGSDGGGLRARTLTMSGTQFVNNTAGRGGGADVAWGVVLVGGRFENNRAGAAGGLFAGSLAMTGTEFISNAASFTDGGGAHVGCGEVVLVGGRFIGNTAESDGGGLFACRVTMMTGTEFISNTAGYGGGAATSAGEMISGGRFENNHADYYGGGLVLVIYDPLVLSGTVFVGNTAIYGGGVFIREGGENSRLVNALFIRNGATGCGAAFYLFVPSYYSDPGNVGIIHTTIASPTIGTGAAICVSSGTVRITNTIVASYTVGIERQGGVTVTEDYNLFFNAPISGSVASGGHSLVGLDPAFLDPAGDDYHLWMHSPAVDAGVDAGVVVDMDGDVRPMGEGYDIGADELRDEGFHLHLPLVLGEFWLPATTQADGLTLTNQYPMLSPSQP